MLVLTPFWKPVKLGWGARAPSGEWGLAPALTLSRIFRGGGLRWADVYIYVYIDLYVCVYIYIYIHTHLYIYIYYHYYYYYYYYYYHYYYY